MRDNIKVASYKQKCKGKQPMKPDRFVWCLFIVCVTILAFTLLTRDSLCELRIRDGNKEVTAFMAYESK